MSLKLLHLNIFQGKFLPQIIYYVKEHDFDILHFQEVSAGSMSQGGVWSGERAHMTNPNPEAIGVNCFDEIKTALHYEGILNVTTAKRHDADSYIGNATFFKKSLHLIDTKQVFLKPYAEQGDTPIPSKELPRSALFTTFSFEKKHVTFVNCHLAWGPNSSDEPYKLQQGKILHEHIQDLTTPFVLTGDFNLDKSSQIVSWMSELGINLIEKYNITNTLNPKLHAAKVLFPEGLGVDFAFVSKNIPVSDFHLVDTPDLSDHYGLSLTLEI